VSFEIGACLTMAGFNGMHVDSDDDGDAHNDDDDEQEQEKYLDVDSPA
jgi:hypothetical protein